MLSDPIIYFLYFLVSAFLCLGFGTILLSLIPSLKNQNNNFTFLFLSLMLGLTLISFLTAVTFTGFKTILVLILPGGGILVYFLSKSKLELKWSYSKPKLGLILSFLLVFSFLIKYTNHYNLTSNRYISPHSDYILYSIVTNSIVSTGNENTYLASNFINSNTEGVSPYHYTLLWINGFFASVYNLTYLNSLLFIVYPLMLFCFLLSLLSLCEVFSSIKFKSIIIVLLLLFVCGIHLNLYYNIPFMSLTGVFCRNIVSELGNKYGYIYSLIILSIIIWHYYGIQESLIIWLLVPLNFAASAPGIFLAFPVLLWLIRKEISHLFILIFCWVFTMVGYFSFYFVYSSKSGQTIDLNFNIIDSFLKFLNTSNLKTAFNVIAGTSIHLFLIFLPFVILLILLLGKNLISLIKNPFAIFTFLTLCFGLITWAVFFEIIDMVQMVNGCGILFLNCFIMFLIVKSFSTDWNLYSNFRKIGIGIITIFIVTTQLFSRNYLGEFNITSSYSDYYVQKVVDTVCDIPKNKNIYVANISENYAGIFDMLSYQKTSSYFLYNYRNIIPVCLDDFDTKKYKYPDFQKKEAKQISKSGFLYQFVENQKSKNNFISLDNSRLDVLDSLKINFLSIDGGSSFSTLLSTKFTLLSKDSISGESFYIRKNNL